MKWILVIEEYGKETELDLSVYEKDDWSGFLQKARTGLILILEAFVLTGRIQ